MQKGADRKRNKKWLTIWKSGFIWKNEEKEDAMWS